MKLVGRLMGQTTRSLRRQGVDVDSITDSSWRSLIASCVENNTQAKEFEGLVRRECASAS